MFIDNNITVNTSIDTDHYSIDPHNSTILQLLSHNDVIMFIIISPKTLTQQQVNHMKTISYYQERHNTNNIILGDTCVICCTKYLNTSILRILPYKHAFHIDCIDKWLLNYSNKCPVSKQ